MFDQVFSPLACYNGDRKNQSRKLEVGEEVFQFPRIQISRAPKMWDTCWCRVAVFMWAADESLQAGS